MQKRASNRFLMAALPVFLLALAAFTLMPPLQSASIEPSGEGGCDSTPAKPAVMPFKDQRKNRPFLFLVPMCDSAGRIRYLLERPGDGC